MRRKLFVIDQPDLFGRHMKMTMVNVADALAAAATLMMGETNECKPLAILKREGLHFTESTDVNELKMALEEDLYSPLFFRS